MAGRTINHWADAMLLGFSSSRSNAIEKHNLTETFYLYRVGSRADEAMNSGHIANAFTLASIGNEISVKKKNIIFINK
jgi:hypothetical protein